MAGAIKLYQQAAKLPSSPRNFMPEIRFREWLSWAYRYAQVLGVADKFVQQVRRSKIAAHRGEKFEFLIDAISSPDFDPQKEYTIGELLELADTSGQSASNIAKSLNSEGVRDAIATVALSLGYVLRFEKKRLKGENKPKLRFLFTPIQAEASERLRGILRERGVDPDGGDEMGVLPDTYFVAADAKRGATSLKPPTSQPLPLSSLQTEGASKAEPNQMQAQDETFKAPTDEAGLDAEKASQVFALEVMNIKLRLYQNRITLVSAIEEIQKMIEYWEPQLLELGCSNAIGVLREALRELYELQKNPNFGQGK
jgi:hypothetical protein